MTSSPPTEAQHFGGQRLTLESPLPIHVPELSNIPVLEKQNDPVFNLTSTHLQQPAMASNSNFMDTSTSRQALTTLDAGTNSAALETTEINFTNFQGNSEIDGEGDDDSAISYENEELAGGEGHQEADTFQTHSTSSLTHPSAPIAALEPLSTLHQPDSTTLPTTFSQNHPGIPDQISESQEPSQLDPLTNGQTSAAPEPAQHDDAQAQVSAAGVSHEGVNYDTLLDSLSPSTSTAPSAENIASVTTAAPSDSSNLPRPSSAEQPLSALPVPAGLPPRPPPQEKPAIHPNYNAENDISTYHFPQTQTPTAQNPHPSQPSNPNRSSQGYPHPTPKAVGANGLPPPPLATFQQPASQSSPSQTSPLVPGSRQTDGSNDPKSARPAEETDEEVVFTPEIEALWAEFIREEAVYVSEGLWDRFPHGSRLFVGKATPTVDLATLANLFLIGNLFTEKATKRDLFYVFHRYGRLAQISIKNAYGFIQYHDAVCCQRALQAEQGEAIRGRKMRKSLITYYIVVFRCSWLLDLEVSKPQKNARNAAPTAAGDNLRAGYNKRPRSPDYGRGLHRGGQRSGNDRYDRGVPSGGSRDLRRRDDYRPMRSPSPPRGFRGRDEYRGPRGRSPDRYYGGRRSRSRSPPYGRSERYRSRSPFGRDVDEEASLPIPRRAMRDVPDVQLILVDQVDR